MSINSKLDVVHDLARDLEFSLRELERDFENTELGEDARRDFADALGDLCTEVATELEIPFPAHWKPQDHPVLELLDAFRWEWRIEHT